MNDIDKANRIKFYSTGDEDLEHRFYYDPKNVLKIYVVNILWEEIAERLEYELRPDKGVFLYVTNHDLSARILCGYGPKIRFEVAGVNEHAITDRSEAIEFMIDKIVAEIDQKEQTHDIPAIKNSLREVLSRQ